MKTTVIHHSADFDGLFCREIARKFLPPDTEFIGWDFGDAPLPIPTEERIYVMDLPIDQVFGMKFSIKNGVGEIKFLEGCDPNILHLNYPMRFIENIIWIDHHKTAIETHRSSIAGYRIDGVAACRLAWQWFYLSMGPTNPKAHDAGDYALPIKQEFVDRKVSEPLAIQLAGEYDIHDYRMDSRPEVELFQCGLKGAENIPWTELLQTNPESPDVVSRILKFGFPVKFARDNEYREVIQQQGFTVKWEGLTFLACNSHELDIRSQLFEAGIKPEHDALMGFTFTGHDWRVSLYGVPGKPDIDLSVIAKKYGGGGHKQACGFRSQLLPFWQIVSTETLADYLQKCYGNGGPANLTVAKNIIAMLSP